MKFELYFDMGNAAFADDSWLEASNILDYVSNQLVLDGLPAFNQSQTIRDTNGNDIGRWKVVKE